MRAAWAASMILVRVSNNLFEQVESDFRYPGGRDAGHAAMVDGAFPFETRTALYRFADDARERAGGSGGQVVSGAENRNRGNAQRRGHVHPAGVIGEIDAACGRQIDVFR